MVKSVTRLKLSFRIAGEGLLLSLQECDSRTFLLRKSFEWHSSFCQIWIKTILLFGLIDKQCFSEMRLTNASS